MFQRICVHKLFVATCVWCFIHFLAVYVLIVTPSNSAQMTKDGQRFIIKHNFPFVQSCNAINLLFIMPSPSRKFCIISSSFKIQLYIAFATSLIGFRITLVRSFALLLLWVLFVCVCSILHVLPLLENAHFSLFQARREWVRIRILASDLLSSL